MNKVSSIKMLMENFKEYVTESHNQLYFKTYTDAINSALKYSVERGYTTDEDERFQLIAVDSKKPATGEYTKVHLPLYKNGKPQRKYLHIIVYGMENSYELTRYIN